MEDKIYKVSDGFPILVGKEYKSKDEKCSFSDVTLIFSDLSGQQGELSLPGKVCFECHEVLISQKTFEENRSTLDNYIFIDSQTGKRIYKSSKFEKPNFIWKPKKYAQQPKHIQQAAARPFPHAFAGKKKK